MNERDQRTTPPRHRSFDYIGSLVVYETYLCGKLSSGRASNAVSVSVERMEVVVKLEVRMIDESGDVLATIPHQFRFAVRGLGSCSKRNTEKYWSRPSGEHKDGESTDIRQSSMGGILQSR